MKPLAIGAALFVAAAITSTANAANSFVGTQTDADTWSYVLTLDGNYNFSYYDTPALTITLTGLTGVTAATIPNATTHSGSTDYINQYVLNAWSVDILDGGSTVVWTKSQGGSGNSGAFSISGFSIDAPGAINGTVSFATNGLIDEVSAAEPFSVDVTGTTDGPVGAGPVVPEPASLGLLAVGGAALLFRRRK